MLFSICLVDCDDDTVDIEPLVTTLTVPNALCCAYIPCTQNDNHCRIFSVLLDPFTEVRLKVAARGRYFFGSVCRARGWVATQKDAAFRADLHS